MLYQMHVLIKFLLVLHRSAVAFPQIDTNEEGLYRLVGWLLPMVRASRLFHLIGWGINYSSSMIFT